MLFYHFKDKRGLYLAALERCCGRFWTCANRDRESTSEDRLRGLFRRQIE